MAEEVNSNSRLVGMFGLARRAGKITYGFDAVFKDIMTCKAKAVFLSLDASPRTNEKVKDVCENYNVRLAVLPISKEQLGQSIGRDDTAVVSIEDKSFADRITELAGADSKGKNE